MGKRATTKKKTKINIKNKTHVVTKIQSIQKINLYNVHYL